MPEPLKWAAGQTKRAAWTAFSGCLEEHVSMGRRQGEKAINPLQVGTVSNQARGLCALTCLGEDREDGV